MRKRICNGAKLSVSKCVREDLCHAELGLGAAANLLKTSGEAFAELLELEGITPAPYVGRYKWVMLERSDILHKEELEDLIRQSYVMVAAKLPEPRAKGKPRKPGEKLIGER
jgi:predicted DNA-binding protein (MmcQ/YjbR family)